VDRGAEVLDVRPGDHVVLFYRDDDELAEQVSGYLLGALQDNGVAIVVATPAHRLLFEELLAEAGVDIAAERAGGCYLALDADETMRRFLVADWPDPASFWRVISPLIRQAAMAGQPVHVYGEMVSLLWDSGLVQAAIEVEALWNELGAQYPFSLFCAYPERSVSGGHHLDALTEVCRAHVAAAGIPAEPGD
jgi:hypothetical protein